MLGALNDALVLDGNLFGVHGVHGECLKFTEIAYLKDVRRMDLRNSETLVGNF